MSAPGYSQADTRRFQKFWDQHGREWHGVVENKTGHACGALEPKFDAPWIPPQQYLVPVKDRLQDVRIDYETMLMEYEQAHADYYQRIVEEARARQWDVPEPGHPLPESLLAIVGERPNAIEPVLAAMQGNSWVLGLSTRVDPRLVEYVETRASRRQKARRGTLARPDFSDDSLEALLDLEEQVDPQATGGTMAVRTKKRPAAAAKE
jgi:hypothetical protein